MGHTNPMKFENVRYMISKLTIKHAKIYTVLKNLEFY